MVQLVFLLLVLEVGKFLEILSNLLLCLQVLTSSCTQNKDPVSARRAFGLVRLTSYAAILRLKSTVPALAIHPELLVPE